MSGNDELTGGAGADNIVAGAGDDLIIISSSGDGDTDTVDGGSGSNTLQLSGGAHNFTNDAKIQNIQILTLNSAGSNVNLTGQTEGLTIKGDDGDDEIISGSGLDIIEGGKGLDTITGSGGADTIKLGNNDGKSDIIIMGISDGMDLIEQFKAGATNGDIFKYTGNLTDVESSLNSSNGTNGSDEILSVDFLNQSKNSSLDVSNLVIGFQTGVTQNGLSDGAKIDFTAVGISSIQILAHIETSLENKNDGGGSGYLSGSSGQQVLQGDANEIKILLFDDGGTGVEKDTAVVLYQEGGVAESDFSGELSILALIDGVGVSALTHDNFYG